MAIAPFLALNNRTGTPQVKRFVNASPAFIGVAITGAVTDTDGINLSRPRGGPSVIKFGGSQTFLASVGAKLFRTTDGGATWTTVKTFTTEIAGAYTTMKTGFYVLHVAGVATAVILTTPYLPSTSYYAHTSTNGTTWTTLGPFTGPVSGLQDPNDTVVWQGKLVTIWTEPNSSTDNAVSTIFDPAAGTMSFATMGSFAGTFMGGGSACVFDNRLFSIMRSFGGGASTRLMELVAGVWTNVNSFVATSGGVVQKTCLFVDGANMYGFVLVGAAWKCYKWTSALGAPTDVSVAVIPTILASGMGTDARMSVIIDSRSTPGSAPTIWLHQSVDGGAGSALNQWQWNGDSSFIGTLPGSAASAPNDSGGSARDNLPWVQHAQGSTFWTSTEDYVQQTSTAPTLGGIIVSFRLYSDAGSGTASVRAWRGTATDEYPLTAATLTGTTTGLTMDNSTIYSVTWMASTDGFSSGDRSKFYLEKF
jgi:hypothetical protein